MISPQSIATLDNKCSTALGICAIGIHEPPSSLENDWFNGILSRKFVPHTGIHSRRISFENEVTMALRAVENLGQQTDCDLRNCAAVVFACSSLIDGDIVRRYLSKEEAQKENCRALAQQFVVRLGISPHRVFCINWGCSGYTRAMEIAARYAARCPLLHEDQFILVVTVNHTSQITDFGCKVTAPIFGDFAQATMLGSPDHGRTPAKLSLLYAAAERQPAAGVFFDYHLRENVTVPAPDGSRSTVPRRLVYSLDMMGLGDAAPRAMAKAAEKALQATFISPQDVDMVIPHQAGASVVNLTAMKLEEIGIQCEIVNGLTRDVGNISSSSIPYALHQNWHRLHGTILCPTAGVSRPGHPSLTQGCLVLRAS